MGGEGGEVMVDTTEGGK